MLVSKAFDIHGQTAIVTGASRGIGKVIAFTLAEAGADVVCVARNEELLNETAADIRNLGKKALVVPADITQEPQVKHVVEQTISHFGKIDILVNNAGDAIIAAVALNPSDIDIKPAGWKWAHNWGLQDAQLTLIQWQHIFDVDVTAAFLFAQAVGPHMMRQRSGNIINITSIYAEIGCPRAAPYCASKAALASFTKTLALEWAPFNIKVNAIAPGFIRTEMTATYFNDPEWAAALTKNVPQGRVGEPREVGLLAVYLASAASTFMTGQSIYLDGGFLAPGRNAMEW